MNNNTAKTTPASFASSSRLQADMKTIHQMVKRPGALVELIKPEHRSELARYVGRRTVLLAGKR